MIECPNCRHQEFVGTFFCSECGTRLIHASSAPDISLSTKHIDVETMSTKPATPEGPELASGAFLGLRIIATGKVISLLGRENYTLGRARAKQAIIPDIDLSEYDAYESGVSRIHAEIQLREDGIYIIDLDSANKTLVNGKKLDPQSPYPIRHGDLLELGSLRLQLVSRYRM